MLFENFDCLCLSITPSPPSAGLSVQNLSKCVQSIRLVDSLGLVDLVKKSKLISSVIIFGY